MPEALRSKELDTAELLAGVDHLEAPLTPRRRSAPLLRRVTSSLLGIGIALGIWQLVVASGWRPEYVLPGPATVLGRLFEDLSADLPQAVATTLRRASVGYSIAFLIGCTVSILASLIPPVRRAVRSITGGLQSMPSIAWFPLAVLLFGLNEAAIYAVVILGAAPAIATAVLDGLDLVPRSTRRLARSMGVSRIQALRHMELPAAVPSLVSGLTLGWAFSWRSLMAGELLLIAGPASLGVRLQTARELIDAPKMLGTMIVILLIGSLVDRFAFRPLSRAVGSRWGIAA